VICDQAHTFIRSSQPDQVSGEQFRHKMHSNCKIIRIVHILYFHCSLEATIFIPHRIVSRKNRTRLTETRKTTPRPMNTRYPPLPGTSAQITWSKKYKIKNRYRFLAQTISSPWIFFCSLVISTVVLNIIPFPLFSLSP
jgi:hypothetical protein